MSGLAFAVLAFARHPEQWQLVREDPSLARNAFEEVVRHQLGVEVGREQLGRQRLQVLRGRGDDLVLYGSPFDVVAVEEPGAAPARQDRG